MNIIYHYPAELFNLLVDTIPLLNRSKKDVIIFFRGAGVPDALLRDVAEAVIYNKSTINKYEIARTVLGRLNERGESTLRERREVLKRVVEFESFESCWDNDRLKAKGLVHEISKLVNVKDSFTRMKQEKEKADQQRREEYLEKVANANKLIKAKEQFKEEISALYFNKNPQERGKQFESVLNRLFDTFGILIRDAFTLNGDNKEGIIEQIDGVVQLNGDYYLVEMKWWGNAVGPDEVAKHLIRVFTRGEARGIFISVNGFTEPAISMCKDALSRAVVVLCDLQEVLEILDGNLTLVDFFNSKIQSAIVDKKPFSRVPRND